MRRAVLAIIGTAAATSALVTLKAYAQDPAAPPAAAADVDPAGAAPPAAVASGRPSGSAAPGGTGGQQPARRINGRTVSTPYGPVTVTITVAGGRITDVSAVLPQAGDSREISGRAGPQLRQQALARQNARLDTVSGASYTSDGYRKSLQSALDQVKRG